MAARAKESTQVEKARRRLQKKFAKEEQRMTNEALRQMALVIESQLARHASERIDLKSKEIELFDSNRHPAAVKSRFVSQLLSDLKAAGKPGKAAAGKLKGRIKAS
ncbi:MAG: hypothetical protein LLG04_03800 [Parachlamydia sp.]|nr:hypothetical protein [Parachlamydia sp.]